MFLKTYFTGDIMTKNIMNFLIIGGDDRQLYLCDALNQRGYSAKIHTDGNLKEELNSADAVILPMPLTKDGLTINSQKKSPEIKMLLNDLQEQHIVFAGLAGNKAIVFDEKMRIFDYSSREELAIKNAIPTAEGVIKLAIENTNTTIFSSKVLVVGFGKTAKAIVKSFLSLGADVTVCARKISDLAFAQTLSCKTIDFEQLNNSDNNFDILINTVPSIVITENTLKTLPKSCLIIEIASAPYGIDFSAARELGFKSIVAGSLPGKIAPKTAGYIICETICNIIKEENL